MCEAYTLRPATGSDEAFLADMFLEALNFEPPFLSLAEWEASYAPDAWPEFRHYTAHWATPGELGITLQAGVVAVHARTQAPVGAAWLRRFPPAHKGFAYLDAVTPELCIGVLPAHRARGLGTRLLQRLAASAMALGCTRLSLSACVRNPALRLYTRLGARAARPQDCAAEDFSAAELARAATVDPDYPNFLLPLPLAVQYLTLLTTPAYAPGAVALAQSLAAVGSRGTLVALCTNAETLAAVQAEAGAPPPPALRAVLHAVALPPPPPALLARAAEATHGARGALLHVDAPRRALWAADSPFLDTGFVLLDADLLAVQNPDPHFERLAAAAAAPGAPPPPSLLATAAFRLKRGCFGSAACGGNFNSGVMVVPQPLCKDGEAMEAMVAAHTTGEGVGTSAAAAAEKVTEESLLNELFSARWGELVHGLNVPKRVLAHAPALWNALIDSRQLVFVHFMGAKPWQTTGRAAADWEAELPVYQALEAVWWRVRRGQAGVDAQGSLLGLLPRGVVAPGASEGVGAAGSAVPAAAAAAAPAPLLHSTEGLMFGACAVHPRQVFLSQQHAIGITNLRPVLPGHVLIITRRQVAGFEALSREEVAGVFLAARAAARALAAAHPRTTGFTFALQDGVDAGQTMPHVHLHVVPRAAAAAVAEPAAAAAAAAAAGGACGHFACGGGGGASGSEAGVLTQPCAQPVLPGHVLVLPARCVARVQALSDAEWVALGLAAQAAGRAARGGGGAVSAVSYCLMDGASAGQVAQHVHMHVVPRVQGDLGKDVIYGRLEEAEVGLGEGGVGGGGMALVVDPAAGAARGHSEADRRHPTPEDMWAEAAVYRAALQESIY